MTIANRMDRLRRHGAVLVGLSAALQGCSSERPVPSLDVATEAPDVESDEERLRKEQMLSMRIFDKSAGEYRLTSDEGYKAIERHCMAAAPHYVELPSTIYCWYEEEGDPEEIEGSEGCQRRVCRSSVDLCRAQLEAKLATEPGTVLDFEDVRIEPQTVAVNSEILAKASRNARRAVGMAAGVLDQAMQGWTPMHGGDCTDYLDVSVSAVSGPSLTLGEVISKNYIDGALLSETLEQKRVDAILATADAELSSSLSQTLALQRSFSSSLLSRAHAVSSLVRHSSSYPTDNGLKGLPGGSLCSSPELTSQASRALEILRQAAPPPTDVLGSTSTTSFLNSNRSSGSIKERLAQFWGRTFTTTLEEELQLSTDDFTEAREYLKNELTLFARSTTQTFQDSNADNYRRYPSTASAPSERDASYWAATGRYDSIREGFVLVEPSQYGDPDDYWPKNNLYSTSGTPHLGLYQEDNPEFRYSVAKFAQKVATNIALLPSAVSHIADRFALLSSTLTPHTIGYGVFDVTPTQTSFKMRMDGYTFDENNPVRLMLGEDGLHCATQGAIEGVPCTAVQLNAHTICYPDIGEDSHWASCDFPITPDASKRFYVVRLRPTATFSNALGGGSVPGSYESMLGASVYVRPQSSNPYAETAEYRKTFAFAPEVERQIAKLLTPNKDFCQRPRMSCAGASFDERVPLENELSSDGDAVESSWRNYLSLAKAAATEADALGTAYITAQLENDLRQETVEMREEARRQDIETALAEFQDLCGTNADPIQLLHLLSGTEDGTDLSTLRQKDEDGNHVTCSNDNQCDDGFSCSSGLCLKDPLDPASLTTDDPELKRALARINECIDGNSVSNFVTLGDQPVCLWHPKDQPSQICKGAGLEVPCPVSATFGVRPSHANNMPAPDQEWHCESIAKPAGFVPANNTIVMTNHELGYFSTPKSATGADSDPTLCQRLKRLRSSYNDGDFNAVAASEMFHPLTLGLVTPNIGWTAYMGGGAAVTMGGQVLWGPRHNIFTTGMLSWCPECNDCGMLTGDECEQAKAEQWAALDDRVLRAVIALRGATVGHLQDIHVPFYIRAENSTTEEGSWIETYPGSTAPVKVLNRSIDFQADSNYVSIAGNGTPRHFRQFHLDIEDPEPLLPAWRAPSGSGIAEYEPFRTVGGDLFEFAIGDVALLNDQPELTTERFPGGRYSWWAHMSSSTVEAPPNNNGIGGLYLGRNPPKFKVTPSYLPGGIYKRVATDCEKEFVGVEYVPSQCSNLSDPKPLRGDYDGCTGSCQYQTLSIQGPFEYKAEHLLDAAELLCAANRDVADLRCTDPPTIQHPRDYQKAKFYVDCLGKEIQRKGAQTVLYGFPERAVDALRKESAVGSFPALGGTLGVEVGHLRAALVQVADIQDKIGYHIRSLGNDFEVLSYALEKSEVSAEIADVEFQSAVETQINACGAAMAGVMTLDFTSIPGRGLAAALTCANTLSQIKFAGSIKNLTQEGAELDQQGSIIEFRQRFEDRAITLSGLATDLGTQIEEIDARLAAIEVAQNKAKRALGRALYKASSAAAQETTISTTYGNIAAVARERYNRAYKGAVKMAFLAKRAIETRLGVKLHELRSDLPLVAAPATWESTLCSSTGVDYVAIKKDDGFDANTFADQFIGDYVRKLENVVESYRLENDFHEGEDVTVISLRDDVLSSKTSCYVASRNLLHFSGRLNQRNIPLESSVDEEPTFTPGWEPGACLVDDACAAVIVRQDVVPPTDFLNDRELQQAPLHELRFPGALTEISQTVRLAPGKHVLSWRAPVGASNCTSSPDVKLFAGTQELSPTSQTSLGSYCAESAGARGTLTKVFDIDDSVDARVVLQARSTTPEEPHFIAAVQLERRHDGLASAYQNTTASLTRLAPVCPDIDGNAFRTTGWERKCLKLCSNGYAEACTGEAAHEECFREATFALNQRGIESGDFLNFAGFAKGNFNYRLSDIAVNFVGSGIASCDGSESPTACYASGNLQYSLSHAGPYYVRNHEGADARLHLFQANIEHARGLATERYLTNPLSSGDTALIDQYMRTEFRGRPLDGNFTLRVWEASGVRFEKIDDVQLMLKYRYWTRFQ
jgi:hypothetical protein